MHAIVCVRTYCTVVYSAYARIIHVYRCIYIRRLVCLFSPTVISYLEDKEIARQIYLYGGDLGSIPEEVRQHHVIAINC